MELSETYAEAWEAADAEGRRAILRRAGFRVTARMLGRHGREWHQEWLNLEGLDPERIYEIATDEDRAREERRRWGVPE